MGKIARYLNQLTIGNVFDTPEVLDTYSTDHSVLKIKPKFVAFPESTDDIRKLMRFFTKLKERDIRVPITVRGSGTSKTGSCLGNGVIISTRKLDKMLEIDTRDRLVRVQSGITLKELNTALSVSGLTVPIDGHDDDTIGGLIATRPVDSAAKKYGSIEKFIERIEIVLSTGDCIQTNRLRKYAVAKLVTEKTPEGRLYHDFYRFLTDEEALLKNLEFKNLTGYPSITKVKKRDTLDLMPLFFGSEGTLGIISEVILKAVPIKDQPARVVATFKELAHAIKYAGIVASLNPRNIDLYDLSIIMEAKDTGKNLDGVIKKLNEGFVVYTKFDEKSENSIKKLKEMRDKFPRTAKFIYESPETKSTLDEFDNSLANYISYVKNGERVPILTDFYLPTVNLESFLKDIAILGKKLKLDLAIYGSLATSIYHLRPKFNLEDPDFNKKATTFLRAGAYIINRQGGELTGGTPEGRVKAVVENENLPAAEKTLYTKLKTIFDANDILNPDVKLGANSKFTLTHFRSTNQPKIML
ncbi:FAD-binding oxidoreductase [Candidatus Saccharibacteria bacterium]|nr:FAD-binding oxidoreductase [Candidatus Saccharibacteria bacterium]